MDEYVVSLPRRVCEKADLRRRNRLYGGGKHSGRIELEFTGNFQAAEAASRLCPRRKRPFVADHGDSRRGGNHCREFAPSPIRDRGAGGQTRKSAADFKNQDFKLLSHRTSVTRVMASPHI